MADWIDKERKNRIDKGDRKYGPWTPENFKTTGRTGIDEAISELLDSINYVEMAWWNGEVSEGFFRWYEIEAKSLLNRLKNLLTQNS